MISILKQSVQDFYPLFYRLEGVVGKPNFIQISGIWKFDYPVKNIPTICLIKMARIISSLNSSVVLLENGYVVEIGVIIRTVKEACAELSFLLEDYPTEELSKQQKQYIDEFFKEEFQDPSDPINTARIHNRVSTKKIHAGFARNMFKMSNLITNEKLRRRIQKIMNPSSHQDTTQVILNTWSGFVHYGYPHSMELVGGDNPDYRLNGLIGTPKINEWLNNLIIEFFAVYNYMLDICNVFNFQKESEVLRAKQLEFQEKTGYNPNIQ